MNRGRADAVRADLATVDRKDVVGDAAAAEASIKGRRKAMISQTEPESVIPINDSRAD